MGEGKENDKNGMVKLKKWNGITSAYYQKKEGMEQKNGKKKTNKNKNL
jgi:hypothetical protein